MTNCVLQCDINDRISNITKLIDTRVLSLQCLHLVPFCLKENLGDIVGG